MNSCVYLITCNDPAIKHKYVGSTFNFTNRYNTHKSRCLNNHQQYLYKIMRDNGGWDNWSINPIEYLNTDSKDILTLRERMYIENLNPSLNKKSIYLTNAERQAGKRKASQKYYNKNKAYYQQYFKQTTICDVCNITLQKHNLNKHIKSKKHLDNLNNIS